MMIQNNRNDLNHIGMNEQFLVDLIEKSQNIYDICFIIYEKSYALWIQGKLFWYIER